MRAIIILSDNIYLTPYLNYYLDILNLCNISYDIIYWDKNNNEKIDKENYYRFVFSTNKKLKKIIGYFKFRSFIKNIIKNNSYNLIIPLHMTIYLIINNYFIRHFKKRFIFDVRDYSYEKFLIFRIIEKRLAKNSLINIISSKGYIKFLPKSKYYIHHNFIHKDYENYKQYNNSDGVIELSFIGLIRFMEQNKKIISFFKNDNRFHLNFIGTNAEMLMNFCKEHNVKNVSLIGTFNSEQTLDYYKKSDGIMNMYGNNSKLLDYALSNKLYYSAVLYKPILVSKNTYMAEITKKYNLGVCMELKNRSELDYLYNYFNNLDRKEYIKNCDLFINDILKEQEKTKLEIIKRIKKLDKR